MKADSPDSIQNGGIRQGDRGKIELINNIKAKHPKIMFKALLPQVFSDIPGVENQGSRGYRKARSEYTRLMGE